ncbi:MAG: dephospho-CoA kinase [Phycisphaerales bacterium JB041]
MLVRPSVWAVLLESLGSLVVLTLVVSLVTVALLAWGMTGVLWSWVLPVALVAALLRLLWQAVVVACRRYVLTGRYVLRVSGVFNRGAATLPIERVQHVVLVRSLLERLTGTGTLGFATAGTAGIEIAWVTIDRPVRRIEEVRAVVERDGERAATDPPGPNPRPVVIGLAGGIGAGKSAVARALAEFGCVVSDSDKAAREALDRQDVRDTLVGWWGPEVLGTDGRVDRKRVAAVVFADPDQRLRLEELVHPIVRQSREELLELARDAGAPGAVIDAPLLFEAGLDAECDAVVFVDAPRQMRLDRVRETRGWDEAELERREKVQIPLDAKRRRSDYEVVNNADPEQLRLRVRRILDQILEEQRGNVPGRSRRDAD